MYRKIISAALLLCFLVSCKAKEPDVGYEVCMSDTACLDYPQPSVFLPKAEKGDFKSMMTARYYYETCGLENIDPQKNMYWTKRLADSDSYDIDSDGMKTDATHFFNIMAGNVYEQLNPENASKIPNLEVDPLLYWVWHKKRCQVKKDHPAHIPAEQCNPEGGPDWVTEAQWKKIITSPPTVKDRKWYQYLPKGCENGECLPK
jgi:hypothetical protein